MRPPEGPIAKKWSMFVMLGEPEYPMRHTEAVFVGPVGTAKSSALVSWVLLRAINYPGMRIALVRESLENLKRSTLQTLFERAGDIITEDFKKRDQYPAWYSKRDERIYFKNGSVIMLFGIGDAGGVDRLVGAEFGAAAVDQLERIPQNVYEVLVTRLRQNVKHAATGELAFPMVKSTANLDKGRSSWINRRFFDGSVPLVSDLPDDVREKKVVSVIDGERIVSWRAYIRARFGENKSINPYYKQALAAAGSTVSGFITDDWTVSVEEVYPEWRSQFYEDEFEDLEDYDLLIGFDAAGGTSYNVAVFGLVRRGTDELLIDNELIEQGRDMKDFATTLAAIINDYVRMGVRRVSIYADPTIWNKTGHGITLAEILAQTLRQYVPASVPLHIMPAFKRGTVRVGPGMADAVKELLREDKLRVHRIRAFNVAEMFNTATWGAIKRDAHPITDIFDATRYLAMNMPKPIDYEEEIREFASKRLIPDWRY